MNRLWQSGFELGDVLSEMDAVDDVTVAASGATVRTGSFSLVCSGANGAQVAFSGVGQVRCQVPFYYTGATGAPAIFALTNGGSSVVEVRVNGTSLELYYNGSLLASGATSLGTGVWYRLGLDCKLAASGWASVYLDGSEVIAYTGDLSAVSVVDGLEINPAVSGSSWSALYVDDVYVDDASGETAPAAPDDLYFHYLTPDGVVSAEWQGSDGDSVDNHLLVDEVPPDGDATHVSATAAATDVYTHAALSLSAGESVVAVTPLAVVKRTGGDSGQIKVGLDDGTSQVLSSAVDPGASYGPVWSRFTQAPDGGAWDQSKVNAARIVLVRSDVTAPSAGLLAQYRAQDLGLSDGSIVSTWSDLVGANDLSGTGTYHTAGPNGKAYVSMTAAQRFISGSAFLGGRSVVDLYLVFRVPAQDGYYFASLCAATGYTPSVGDYTMWGQPAGAYMVNSPHLGNNGASLRTWVIGRFLFNGASSVNRIGGVEVTGDTGTIAAQYVVLGGHDASAGEWANVDIADALIYDGGGSYSPTDVLNALAAQYGLTA